MQEDTKKFADALDLPMMSSPILRVLMEMKGLLMDGHTSTALRPISPGGQFAPRATGCGAKQSVFTGRTEWFLVAAVALAAAGLALGSGLLAASALLPLLYVLPCLLMMGMCMKAHGKGGAPNGSNSG